jgi:hypothetical protein
MPPGRKKFRDAEYIRRYNHLYYLNKLIEQRKLNIQSTGQKKKKLNLEQLKKVLNPTVKKIQSTPIIVKFN